MRATFSVTQMHRGRLHARSCRHEKIVDGPYRPSGRNAYPSGITPPTIMSPARTPCGPSTEIRLSARAHPTTTTNRAHAPPTTSPAAPHKSAPGPSWLRQTSCTDKTERPQRIPQRDHPTNHHVAGPDTLRAEHRDKAERPRAPDHHHQPCPRAPDHQPGRSTQIRTRPQLVAANVLHR